MVKNLSCRIKAYAKLSATVQGQGGGDDFLKKMLTTSKDTLIDLGYKDIETNREVYAIRRRFTIDPIYIDDDHETGDVVYKIDLAESVGRVLSFSGSVCSQVDSESVCCSIPNDTLASDLQIINDKYSFTSTLNGKGEYTFDILFVFIGNKEIVTSEDVGEVVIHRECEYHVHEINSNVTLLDSDGKQVTSSKIMSGYSYTLYVEPYSDYELKSVTFNGNNITNNIPYHFDCNGDVSVTAISEKIEPYKYWYDCSTIGCTVTMRDNDGEEVSPGMQALTSGERYVMSLSIDEDFVFDSATLNGSYFDESLFPYEFICNGGISIAVTCVRETGSITVIVSDSSTGEPIENIYVSINDLYGYTNKNGVCTLSGNVDVGDRVYITDPYRLNDDEYDYYYSSDEVVVTQFPATITRSLLRVEKQHYDNKYYIDNYSTFPIDIIDENDERWNRIQPHDQDEVYFSQSLPSFRLKVSGADVNAVSATFTGMYNGETYTNETLTVNTDDYDPNIIAVYPPGGGTSFWTYNDRYPNYGGTIHIENRQLGYVSISVVDDGDYSLVPNIEISWGEDNHVMTNEDGFAYIAEGVSIGDTLTISDPYRRDDPEYNYYYVGTTEYVNELPFEKTVYTYKRDK